MARTAGQMPRRLPRFKSGAFALAAVPPLGARSAFGRAGESLGTRAIACSGLAALAVLPMLLIASMLSGVPLAVPAAIALGYLASSYALAGDHPRAAAAINGAVFAGLLAWAVSMSVAGEGVSRVAVAAALLAPFFAAAPAFARLVLAPRTDTAARAAERDAACLDRLAPNESVLVVRRDGTLLAATRAARAAFQFAEGQGGDVNRLFDLADRPKIMEAVARSEPGAAPLEVTMRHNKDGGRGCAATSYAATVASDGNGLVSIRLSAVKARGGTVVKLVRPGKRVRPAQSDASLASDLSEAVAFAMKRAGAIAEARGVLVTADVEEGIAAKCERQLGRRVAFLMMEAALTQSQPGDALHLTARALKGVALLRLVGGSSPTPDIQACEIYAVLRRLVDEAGGTLVVDEVGGEVRVSIRLGLAREPAQLMKGMDSGRRR